MNNKSEDILAISTFFHFIIDWNLFYKFNTRKI